MKLRLWRELCKDATWGNKNKTTKDYRKIGAHLTCSMECNAIRYVEKDEERNVRDGEDEWEIEGEEDEDDGLLEEEERGGKGRV